jgi:DNA-damage-inducible protein D
MKENINQLSTKNSSFEDLKKVNKHGVEYWSARELQPLLGYVKWQRFKNVIKKAEKSCKQSGNDPKHHFTNSSHPITGGKGRSRPCEDYQLSRFACYLIIQNGDPRKSEIAHVQKYFAIQARRREISDALAAEDRNQASVEFIDPKEQLSDRMRTTEFIAHQFCMSQTREKLKRENIKNEKEAFEVYEEVRKEVRAAIAKIGGTPPENIPAEEPIKNIKKWLKNSKTILPLKN